MQGGSAGTPDGRTGGPGDYAPLGAFLATRAGRGVTTVTLAFAHVEQLLGRPLPPSARRHQQWWENDRGHAQARTWLDAGWRSGPVQVTDGWVTFTKDTRETSETTGTRELV